MLKKLIEMILILRVRSGSDKPINEMLFKKMESARMKEKRLTRIPEQKRKLCREGAEIVGKGLPDSLLVRLFYEWYGMQRTMKMLELDLEWDWKDIYVIKQILSLDKQRRRRVLEYDSFLVSFIKNGGSVSEIMDNDHSIGKDWSRVAYLTDSLKGVSGDQGDRFDAFCRAVHESRKYRLEEAVRMIDEAVAAIDFWETEISEEPPTDGMNTEESSADTYRSKFDETSAEHHVTRKVEVQSTRLASPLLQA